MPPTGFTILAIILLILLIGPFSTLVLVAVVWVIFYLLDTFPGSAKSS